ncbi:hypothetical protein V502_10715 [Pseudogymnoascus sp. VKM F-4520 (FW-2644)]|nr:hypothetical protein V502_10715 [Pseudogymnoascus sp. VKM F-4520 (FW-2644)]
MTEHIIAPSGIAPMFPSTMERREFATSITLVLCLWSRDLAGPQSGKAAKLDEAKEGLQAGKAASWADHKVAGPEVGKALGRERDHASKDLPTSWQDLQHACLTCMERSSTRMERPSICVDLQNRDPSDRER